MKQNFQRAIQFPKHNRVVKEEVVDQTDGLAFFLVATEGFDLAISRNILNLSQSVQDYSAAP